MISRPSLLRLRLLRPIYEASAQIKTLLGTLDTNL
jgi:hypothetical protein